jgi:hypothetical protein
MRIVDITVLQDDIDNGDPRVSTNCPIARAVKRDMPDIQGVTVGYCVSVVTGTVEDLLYSAELSPEGHEFVAAFDQGYTVESFKMQLKFDMPYQNE